MKNLYCVIPLLFFFMLTSSQNRNTLLVPRTLTNNEIQVVLKEIEKINDKYDPVVQLVESTASPHYHSDFLIRTKVHAVRSSLSYAVLLLDSRRPENRERAFDVLRAVIALQDQNPDSKTCGVWPYYLEEPLATKKSPVDLNWADFSAVPIISIINNHNDILPDDLKEKTEKALLLASQAIRRRDVRPDYTNISLMGLYVCYMTADMYNNAGLMSYARKRLKSFYECTTLNNGFLEYNSPAYFKLSLDEVLRLKNHVTNKEDLAMLDSIYNTGWGIIARHYHKPSAQWAGPHGRAYSPLLVSNINNWLYTSSSGRINPDTSVPFSKENDPALDHKIPEYLIKYFIDQQFPRLEIDTFIRAGQNIELNPLVSYQESDRGVIIQTREVIGKSYFTHDYVLSSANQSSLWNQRRPLIAYWGKSQSPSYLQVRFLHDMYDYAASNIFCAQDSTNVLGAINFTIDGGDKHVTIDLIKNATIKAADLRLRFEFGGDISNFQIDINDLVNNSITGKSGEVYFRIELPYIKFGSFKASLIPGGDDNIKWIDFVIYSGKEIDFDFLKIQEAVLGFLISLKNSPIVAASPVKDYISGDYLNLSWQNLKVKALTKPYPERATLILK